MESYASIKQIIQIQVAPPGWFVIYLGYEQTPEAGEADGMKVDGFFAVPLAGWALLEDPNTGLRGISPFLAGGTLVDENDNYFRVAFRPDWLNVRLNGSETISDSSPFGVSKNRLEVEVKTATYKGN